MSPQWYHKNNFGRIFPCFSWI